MEAPPGVVKAPAMLSLVIVAVALVRAAIRHRSFFGAVASSFLATCGKRKDHKALVVVRQRLLQQKVERVYFVHIFLATLMVPCSLASLRGRPWPLNTEQAAPGHILFASLKHLYLAVVALCPGLVTARSMDALCSVLMLISAAELSPWMCEEANVHAQVSRNMLFLVSTCAARRTSGTPWCYVGFLANFLSAGASFREVFSEITVSGGSPHTAFRAYVLICFLTLALAHFWERNAEGLLLQQLQSEDAKQLLAAASALLRGCCDVVVELDSRGAVLGRAEDLGSYLLRGSALRGMPLTELLVHEEEREQLAERLFRPPEEGMSMAESMPISLRDGNNNMLRVELLWFSFYRFGQELAFMAGFREFAEAAAPPVAAMPVIAAPAGGSCEESETASSASGSLELAVAVLDCTVPNFPIEELSAGFCARIGQLPLAEPFVRHLNKPEAFARWLCRELATSQDGGELSCRKLTFKLPQGRVEAICSLQWGQEPPDLERVGLYFTSVRLKRNRRGSLLARPTISI